MERGLRGALGKILGAWRLAREHRSALNYDLMTRAHRTLSEVPGSLSWLDLADFAGHLPADSATGAELDPDAAETARWLAAAPALVLADIFDWLANTWRPRWRKRFRYPRPFGKEDKRTYGKEPIAMGSFDEWWG